MFDTWSKDQRVFGIGDIHGKWQVIRDFWNNHKLKEGFTNDKRDENIIVLFGDIGINYFFNHRDTSTKEQLMKFPFTYFVIRGNHEERPSVCAQKYPDKWHTEEFWGNTVYVENDYPHIKYALDEATVYSMPYIIDYDEGSPENNYADEGMPIWGFYDVLVLPGAYSVDKQHRLANGWGWFEGEQMTPQEREDVLRLIEQYPSIDLVFSHTCPIIFEPTDLFLSFIDQSLVDKTMERLLGEIEYRLDYKAWIWGHYHAFRDYPRTDGRKKLMLYNDYAIDIKDYLNNEEFIKYEI